MLDFRTDTFLTVCETMNFTEAAKRLHITQPAVSQHIRFLEKKYNTRLFSYCNKQLYLTPAGEILRKRLMTMKNDQLAIMNEIRNESHKMESLSIGVTMTIGEYAIVEGNYPKENYEHKNYSTEEYIAVCARDHTFKEKFPETMQELVKERLLIREPGSGTRNILEELLLARGMGIKDFLHYTEVENMHTIIGLLKRDCGISFMYKIAVADELKNGTLKEIRLSDFKMQHDFDFIWEKGSIYTEKYIVICEELLKKY